MKKLLFRKKLSIVYRDVTFYRYPDKQIVLRGYLNEADNKTLRFFVLKLDGSLMYSKKKETSLVESKMFVRL